MTAAPFDLSDTRAFNEARLRSVESLLDELRAAGIELSTAMDVGCGFGFFTGPLLSKDLQVTAVDGRPENVDVARSRNPGAQFATFDVEDQAIVSLGQRDLVLCLGLLYHLENPFRAIRNLWQLTGRVMIAESVCAPGQQPATVLYEEDRDTDQGLNYVALIPTESWLVSAMYHAGFAHVYRPKQMPDHPYFRPSLTKRRRRTLLVASRVPIAAEGLLPIPRSSTRRHIWDRSLLRPVSESQKLRSAVQRAIHRVPAAE